MRSHFHRISSVLWGLVFTESVLYLFLSEASTPVIKRAHPAHITFQNFALHFIVFFFFWCFVSMYLWLKECSKSLSVWMIMHINWFFVGFVLWIFFSVPLIKRTSQAFVGFDDFAQQLIVARANPGPRSRPFVLYIYNTYIYICDTYHSFCII